MKKAVIYYFTGTGNSKHIAETTASLLSDVECSAEIINIEKNGLSQTHHSAELVYIVAPVYGFILPDIMGKFLANMPKSNNQKTIVYISACNTEYLTIFGKKIALHPHAGFALPQSILTLKAKGYIPIIARTLEMANNWTLAGNPPDNTTLDKIIANTKSTIQSDIQTSLQEKNAVSINISDLLILPVGLLFLFIGRHILGKCFVATDKCNECRICEKSCPNKVIIWRNNRPYWKWNCLQCCRCINICPQNAIEVHALSTFTAIALSFVPYILAYFVISSLRVKGFGILLDITIGITFTFGIMWVIQFANNDTFLRKLLPLWYLTKNRIRYKKFVSTKLQ